MKVCFIVIIIFGSASIRVHAQAEKIMGEQLLALKTLRQNIKDNYTSVMNGLSSLDSQADSEYRSHSRYFSSLYKVNPNIASSTKQSHEKNNDRPGLLSAESSRPGPDSSRPH